MNGIGKDKMNAYKIFFSYAHKDEKMWDRLEVHLSVLKREAVISNWHDRKITPGDSWKGQVDEHIQNADIVFLLVSVDFLNSDYCYDVEFAQALKQHESGESIIVPIILESCDWTSTPIGRFQALPRDGKPVSTYPVKDNGFHEIVRGIRRLVDELVRRTHDRQVNIINSHPEAYVAPSNTVLPIVNDSGIILSNDIVDQLERMRIINALAKTDEDSLFDDGLMNEYLILQDKMVEIFMPLVKLLAKAGLLTTNINIEDIQNIDIYKTLTGEPTAVFENGNIWIDTEYSGGNLNQNSEDKVISGYSSDKKIVNK